MVLERDFLWFYGWMDVMDGRFSLPSTTDMLGGPCWRCVSRAFVASTGTASVRVHRRWVLALVFTVA